MALDLLTTEEIKENNVTSYENKIGQDAPINDKSFINVQSAINAMNITQLLKFAIERSLQNLALTATGKDLEAIGFQFDTPKRQATAAALTADLPAENGTIITILRTFTSLLTGARYTLDAQSVAAGGVAVLGLTAEQLGSEGNLDPGAQLVIDTPVPGAETVATVVTLDSIGVAVEDEEIYRARVLDAIRRSGGGGNSADYRAWAQEVSGVQRAFPFAGKPVAALLDSSPPDRTVYVQATEAIDPDGIAPQPLLDAVRDRITTNSETLRERQPLGLTDETLFVESITRTGFFVEVRGLAVPLSDVVAAKQGIEDALGVYYKSLQSFVEGLDPDFDKNDFITDVTISGVVDDVLRSFGGSAAGVGFGLAPGSFASTYNLAMGELAKLETVAFL